MARLALADALTDFDAETAARRALQRPAPQEPSPTLPNLHTDEALACRLAEAGEALEGKLRDAFEAELEAERERHAGELAEARLSLGEAAGETLARRFAEMEERVCALTASVAARILGAALSEEVAARSVAELARAIRSAVGDRETVRIRIEGPVSLYEGLRGKLGTLEAQTDFSETDAFDLRASIDESLFETRLSEWSAALSGAMA